MRIALFKNDEKTGALEIIIASIVIIFSIELGLRPVFPFITLSSSNINNPVID